LAELINRTYVNVLYTDEKGSAFMLQRPFSFLVFIFFPVSGI
jgi:hypothetical protein